MDEEADKTQKSNRVSFGVSQKYFVEINFDTGLTLISTGELVLFYGSLYKRHHCAH